MAAAQDDRNGDRDGSAESPGSEDFNEKVQSPSGSEAQNNGAATQPPPHEARQRLATGDMGKPQDGPEGGFDNTPIPAPPTAVVGHTLKFTFHRASNLVMGDAHAFSSDPYILAQLNTGLRQRHKEDPPLRFRSPTVRKNVDPVWQEDWIVANVPSSGFTMKVRVYDEDPADTDDLLGKAHINIPSVHDGWEGLKVQPYELSMRRSSKRAVLVRSLAVCFGRTKHITGELFVSIENLGRTGEDGQNCRAYTVGPCRWFRHYSPVLGRIAGVKEPEKEQTQNCPVTGEKQKSIEQYNFQANQMQLQGPVPSELYHRFVEFKPWVSRMFTAGGLQGIVLSKALHHQHTRVYSFGRSTAFGHFPQGPCKEMTQQFLDLVSNRKRKRTSGGLSRHGAADSTFEASRAPKMSETTLTLQSLMQVHYDRGGRIFTYVITLDSLFRFTETGKEFGVDMLSKHTMHSDVSVYIAFSGEFFIRRLKHKNRPPPPQPTEDTTHSHPDAHRANETSPPHDIDSNSPDDDPPKDPARYELVIDNDSGTYRPNAALLPILASYLAHSLPGIHIQTLDCQADADKMSKMKSEQRERKKREGENIVYAQGDETDSLSSSDDERLNAVQDAWTAEQAADAEAREDRFGRVAARDWKRKQAARVQKGKRVIANKARDKEAPPGASNTNS